MLTLSFLHQKICVENMLPQLHSDFFSRLIYSPPQFAAVGAFAVAAFFLRVFSQTSLALIAALYGAYACAIVALAFLLSTLFARARTAGTVSAFALLLAFVPYFAVSGAATSRAAKLVLALLAPTSFALALDRLLDYQAGSQGMAGIGRGLKE